MSGDELVFKEKNRLVKKLRDAKKAHRRWVSNAQILLEGIPVKNDQLPLNDTECGFGQWYYSEGQALRGYSIFREIEPHHQRLHGLYLQIFRLLFNDRKRSFFDRLLGRKAEPSPEDLAQAQALIAELNGESIRIMELLDRLEEVIKKMDSQDFHRLFLNG